jgi:cytochrome c oxidase subunit 2
VCGAALLLSGCGGQQDALAPKSHQSRDIASLFWWMMGAAFVGMGVIVFLLLLAWKRRHRRGIGGDTEGDKPGERFAWFVVVGAGVVLPIILLAALFVVSDILVIGTTQAPAASSTRLTIEVTGHEWWWEVRYPGTKAVAANEIHIPVRTPVRVEVRTADVIHSFWVPELNRKIDAIPGQQNVVELYADAVGRYRGACAEFCGLQHTHMDMYVFADTPAVFQRWLAGQAAPAAAPATPLAQLGEEVFTRGSCASCHTVRGTTATGSVGPDLTHLSARTTLAALTIPNTERELAAWITGSQHIKPGNQMPDIQLSGPRLRALIAYLAGLK